MHIIRSLRYFAALILAGFVAVPGCGYRIGTTLPPGMETIYIPVFKNKTQEANIEFSMTNQTIDRFLIDGSLKVVEKAEADVILHVTIIQYWREPVRYAGKDFNIAKEYRLHVVTECSLVWKDGTSVFKKKLVSADTDFFIGDDLTESERVARGFTEETMASELPTLEEDLAQAILEEVIEGW